jgi:hypothetical protein
MYFFCDPPSATCSDNVKNGNETCVDGGGDCPNKCAEGADCLVNGDCATGLSCANNTCAGMNKAKEGTKQLTAWFWIVLYLSLKRLDIYITLS